MSGLNWLFVSSCLLLGLMAGHKNTAAKEQIYYKQSYSTAANETQPNIKQQVRLTMEGQMQSMDSKINSRIKGSRIVPKKGALDKSIESINENDTLIDLPLMKPLKKIKVTSVDEPKNKSTANPIEISSSDKPSLMHIVPVKEDVQQVPEVVMIKTSRKPKPKPILTIGGKEADGPIPAFPTDKSTIIMPRKIDYLVPVLITFTVLPLLGITFHVLYKRGKDYWSKRHYRRMDFLIDGMYNE